MVTLGNYVLHKMNIFVFDLMPVFDELNEVSIIMVCYNAYGNVV